MSFSISMLQECMNSVNVGVLKADMCVGMCATEHCGSDMYAMVIVGKPTPKSVNVTRIDYEDMEKIVKNREGIEYMEPTLIKKYLERTNRYTYKLRKNGRWVAAGTPMHGTPSLSLGYAENYLDPSF